MLVFVTLQETASKYELKIKDGDKEIDEEIEVDTEKQTERYRIRNTDSGNSEEVDVVYDFKKVKYYRKGKEVCDCISFTCSSGK